MRLQRWQWVKRTWLATALAFALALGLAGMAEAGDHTLLAKDGVHDPASPAVKLLQEPREALAGMPKDAVGNRVDWIRALEQGLIAPRASVLPGTEVRVLNLDVLLPRTGEMPMVLFPHRQHTEWLDCSNCHEQMFQYKAGSTKNMNMFAILQGEYCGRCHGAVAFPLTECRRCHSVPRQ